MSIRPVKKPPKCPEELTLVSSDPGKLTEILALVIIERNKTCITRQQQSMQRTSEPIIRPRASQLTIISAKNNPIIPVMPVEAPALTDPLQESTQAEKMFPPIPETK